MPTTLLLRPGRPEDDEALGQIHYRAFRSIAEAHGFPPDWESAAVATRAMAVLLVAPGTRGMVAEVDGRVVGATFIHDRGPVAAIGPVIVDPAAQDRGIGRLLMEDAMAWAEQRRFPSVRLVQAAYHNRSMSLYTKLGFDAVEPLSVLQGPPPARAAPAVRLTRPATPDDVPACDAAAEGVFGFARGVELSHAIDSGTATVVERDGRVVGYSTDVGFWGHSVASTNEELQALIATAPSYRGAGFLLPTRNAEVLRWCLTNGLRIVQPMTLMVKGSYREPTGAYLPSISF